jgi:hypothetical protein
MLKQPNPDKIDIIKIQISPQPAKTSRPSVLGSLLTSENISSSPEILIKGALLGPTGSGKTQSSITLPKSKEKPLLLVDLDGRWETVREEVEAGTVKVLSLFDPDPASPKAWDQIESLRKELWSLARKGEFPFSGIIEDGLSMMARLAMNSALLLDSKRGLGGAAAKQHYIPQIHYLVTHINSMRTLPCHYIINGHFDMMQDEEDGKLKILPKITKSLRTEFPSWFNEVYYCFRDEDKESNLRYYWTTAGVGRYDFFKSTLNNKQKYWDDPIMIDFSKSPVGFEKLLSFRGKDLSKGGEEK